MPYKITHGNGTVKVQQGQVMKFNIEYRMGDKDTILNTTFGHVPAFVKIDTNNFGKYNFTEVLTQCKEGDKIDFTLSIDTLKKMGMIPDGNPMFAKRSSIKGKVEILKLFTSDADANADVQKEFELEKGREVKDLEKYVADKNLKTEKSKNGVLVKVDNAGTGDKADSGKQVTIYYKGYFKDGKVFDSNMGDPKKQAFTFVVGAHSVIPGWDEALKFFGKGGKGSLFIPAMLAYGQQGSAPVIPPYTNLFFDIEVADVTTPAPQPAQPQMPGAPQQQPQAAPSKTK
ncbi:MAG: FKBP-type peptidyl-prolyl cis-trans isomerase [Bacteroidota bacterium]|nr:FKBP-type peptidyl-prolyl cis-trans isomerase [Bacteroidota bacterium]